MKSFKFIRRFLAMEAAGGILMIAAAALAMLAANSPFAELYQSFILMPVAIGFGEQVASHTLSHWVKDVLMVFFFLLIGLELKREMAEGVLARRDQILLPLVAALGGMVAPALVYLLINTGIPQNFSGWAIPSATDIAFALCVLMMVGKGVPPAAKIFLLAIAIFDDLGAILVIAFFYSGGVQWGAVGMAGLGVAALFALNRLGVARILAYLAIGVYLWFCLHAAGIHTTIAGVLVGVLMPMRVRDRSPVNHTIHFLHPWVGFFILPIFAFTSAGVSLAGISLQDALAPLPLGIALGLFLGKQIGIFGATWAMVKSGFAKLPEGTSWLHIYGVSVVAGIGFTMSLFIGILAFPEAMQNEVKIGVIGGSLLSTLWGIAVFRVAAGRDAISR